MPDQSQPAKRNRLDDVEMDILSTGPRQTAPPFRQGLEVSKTAESSTVEDVVDCSTPDYITSDGNSVSIQTADSGRSNTDDLVQAGVATIRNVGSCTGSFDTAGDTEERSIHSSMTDVHKIASSSGTFATDTSGLSAQTTRGEERLSRVLTTSDASSTTGRNDRTRAGNVSLDREGRPGDKTGDENHSDLHVLQSRWRYRRRIKLRQWTAGVCSVLVFVWTVFFSYNAAINPDPFIGLVNSSSNTRIFLIAFWSQITICTITWLTHEVFNCVRWSWISSGHGDCLTNFLVLNPSTSPFALVQFLIYRVLFSSKQTRTKRVSRTIALTLLRLGFYGLMLFLGVILLLNTSDGPACLSPTVQAVQDISGTLPVIISTRLYLHNPYQIQQAHGSNALNVVPATKSGNIFDAPKTDCKDERNCTSLYLAQRVGTQMYKHITSYNGTRDKIYKLQKTPILHAIVEPFVFPSGSCNGTSCFDVCNLYGPPARQVRICGADVVDPERNETVLVFVEGPIIESQNGEYRFPEGQGDCRVFQDKWSLKQFYAVRVHMRYADITYGYENGRVSGGFMIQSVDNVSLPQRSEWISVESHLKIYDTILPRETETQWTDQRMSSTLWRNLDNTRLLVGTGVDAFQAGLATLLWRVPLEMEVTENLSLPDNQLNGSECETVDQIRLSFDSFYFFTIFCGLTLAICLCLLVGAASSNIPAIESSFPEVALLIEISSGENIKVMEQVARLYDERDDPGTWSTMKLLDGVKIQITESDQTVGDVVSA